MQVARKNTKKSEECIVSFCQQEQNERIRVIQNL